MFRCLGVLNAISTYWYFQFTVIGFIGLLTPSQVEGHVYNAVPMALGPSLEELSPSSEGTSHLTVSTGLTYCGQRKESRADITTHLHLCF